MRSVAKLMSSVVDTNLLCSSTNLMFFQADPIIFCSTGLISLVIIDLINFATDLISSQTHTHTHTCTQSHTHGHTKNLLLFHYTIYNLLILLQELNYSRQTNRKHDQHSDNHMIPVCTCITINYINHLYICIYLTKIKEMH